MDRNKETSAKVRIYSLQIRGWYRLVRGIVRFLLLLLSRVKVEGLEHVPDKGPYLLVTNHLHWLDPPVIMAFYPHRSHIFVAEKWYAHWLLGPLFRSLDAIFVQRGEVDRKALRQALAVLQGGGVLGLAPEGTRSRTGAMQRGRSGAAYMAYHEGVKLVPVVTWGQEKLFPSLWRFHRAEIRVVFGLPFEPLPVEGKASAAQVHAFTEEIMYHLASMLPPAYRGVYGDVPDKRPDLLPLVATSNLTHCARS
jgi:1-acyl-sn-glycerol-3-phosphate acyltransferase